MKKIVLFIICLVILNNVQAQSRSQKKWVRKQYATLSLNEKIAQLMIIRAHSAWDAAKVDSLAAVIKKYNVGGLCFFSGWSNKRSIANKPVSVNS
jgi:hypothetical protein